MRLFCHKYWCFCAVLVVPVSLRAQYSTTAEVEPSLAATNYIDATAAGSVIELDERIAAGESITDILPEVPSTRTFNLGTHGSFVGVSLRGAEAGQSSVLWGTLPLGSIDRGPFDLSLIPLFAVERIEVYRGGAPAWLSGGEIGGVVRVVPRKSLGNQVHAKLELGSFGFGRGDVAVSTSDDWGGLFIATGLEFADDEFPFINNNNTPSQPADDFRTLRFNAESFRFSGLTRVDINTKAGEISLSFLSVVRDAGEPGPVRLSARQTDRTDTRVVPSLEFKREATYGPKKRAYQLQVLIGAELERTGFSDEFGELGVPRDSKERSTSVNGRVALMLEAAAWLELTGVAFARFNHFELNDALAPIEQPTSERWVAGATAETRLHGTWGQVLWELRPSVRLAWTEAELGRAADETGPQERVQRFTPVYRLGAGLGPAAWISIVASLYKGIRLPTVLETFGDRGLSKANPALRPEEARGVDYGIVLRKSSGSVQLIGEVRGYHVWYDDLIQLTEVAQGVFISLNQNSAKILGVGGKLDAAFGKHVVVYGVVSWQKTRDQNGRRLPLRPDVNAGSRIQAHTRELSKVFSDLSVFVDVTYTGEYPFSAVGALRNAQTWVALGVAIELFHHDLVLRWTVRDVFDRGGEDLLSRPLAGRRYLASLAYRKEL